MQGNGIFKYHNFHFKISDSFQIFGRCTTKVSELIPKIWTPNSNSSKFWVQWTGGSWSMEKCREMGFSNTITFTSKYQIHFKFLKNVQLRFLNLFLEFELLTRILVNFVSNWLIRVGIWKSAGKWDFQIS